MSKLNCDACANLREYAPDFVNNGVTDEICASLMNDTGLNPKLTVQHTNCDDLHDVNDCLIGNMPGQLEAYDVCGWKEFMTKLIPNLYETLKALICSICGIWGKMKFLMDRMDLLCKSLDNVLDLINGALPKTHHGTWTDYWKSIVEFADNADWTWDHFYPTFRCDVLDGAGCNKENKLGRYMATWEYTPNEHYPKVFWFSFKAPLRVGEVIATVPRSAVPDDDMSLAKWKDMLRAENNWQWGTVHGDTILTIATRGYVRIDGEELNTDLRQYGENTCVFYIQSIVGASNTGGFSGADEYTPIRTYRV